LARAEFPWPKLHRLAPTPHNEFRFEEILLTGSAIDATLLQAYRDTEYRVHGDDPFTLQIGHPSPALAAAQKHQQVGCSAYITASNPFSMALGDETNEERHADLARELTSRSLIFIEGVGQHPSNE
jgi:hypothetical protein